MNFRNRILLPGLLLICLFCNSLFGAPTTVYQAERVVIGWLKTDYRPLETLLGGQVAKVKTFTNDDGEPVYYIVNLDPAGFVIVSADDLVEPIIGFADDGSYEASLDNPLGALVINDLNGRIEAVRDVQVAGAAAANVAASESQAKWKRLEAIADGPVVMGLPSVSDVRVAPLIKSQWSQSVVCGELCYNYYTPNNYVCGCVATAMAQLMLYHQHPTEGIGVHTFTISVDDSAQDANTRGGDGSGGPYSWDDMVLVPDCNTTETQRQAIGALCYDAGVSVYMKYSGSGSGAYLDDTRNALANIFKYENAVFGGWDSILGKSLYGMINPNLDGKYPVILGIFGYSNWAGKWYGHAIVSDGYGYNSSTAYHHLNMGWAGTDDAWYNLPNVDTSFPYSHIRACVYNIRVNKTGDGEMISGRVLDAYGYPVANATVSAELEGQTIAERQTDSRGIYALDVNSNTTYIVYASVDDHYFPSQTVTTGMSSDYSAVSGNVWGVEFCDRTILFVDDNAPNDPGPGNPAVSDPLEDGSGLHPYDSIQEAIDYADEGVEIEVAPGTYNEAINFGGKAVRLYSSGGPEATTIDANGIEDANHAVRCVNAEDANTVLEGFTITGGVSRIWQQGDPDDKSNVGAGMLNVSTSPTVINCIFTGNVADHGGGMYNHTNSNPTVTNCIFTSNKARGSGGGMANYQSSPIVTNCRFSGNQALSHVYGGGGGMYNQANSNPTLTGCTFSGNTSSVSGGGIFNNNSSPTVMDCTFTGNTSVNGGMFCSGGGMSNIDSSSPTVMDCTFTGNTSAFGGAMSNNESSPTVTNCVFIGNDGIYWGGGMGNSSRSRPTLQNCTFSSNIAANGGGIYNNTSSNPTITNCILWNDTPSEIVNGEITSSTVSYSDVWGGYSGTGNINADPCFADTDNPDPNLWNLRLKPDSPCIDAGDNSAPGLPATDFDGNPRVADSDGDGTATVDMGVFEAGPVHNVTKSSAYHSIQGAIDDANDGDEIKAAPGTYNENIDFKGKAVRLYSIGGPTVTTIDAGVGGHVVQCISGEGPDTILEGFTITNGRALGGYEAGRGGGMLNDNYSSPTVKYCIFTNNEAVHGGGMGNYDYSSPTVINCIFYDNKTSWEGGAIACEIGSSPTFTNCTISDNTSLRGGGAVYCRDAASIPLITNCIFRGNKQTEFAFNSPVIVTYSDVEGGTGESWFGTGCIDADPCFLDAAGGDLRLSPGSPCIDVGDNSAPGLPGSQRIVDGDGDGTATVDMGACEWGRVYNITRNYAYLTIQPAIDDASSSDELIVTDGIYSGASNKNLDFRGKALTLRSATRAENCIIDCENDGRGFYLFRGEGPKTIIENFTIINAGPAGTYNGGGICCVGASPTVRNCIIKACSVPSRGGGIYCANDSNSLFENCTIVDCNAGNSGGGISCENGSNPTFVNCLIASNNSVYDGGGMLCYENSSPTIINCTFSENRCSRNGGGICSHITCHPIFTNCIIWANDSGQVYATEGINITFSDVQGGWPDANNTNINADPLFVDASGGDFRILPGSPCIDAGDNDAQGLSGDRMIFDGDDDGTPTVDMGAFEWGPVQNITRRTSYSGIQLAIDDAGDGDSIEVTEGTYYESINFKGKAVTLRSSAGPEVTTIDANGAVHAVWCISGEGPDTILDGFTITGGRAMGGDDYGRGGGMYICQSSPTVSDCMFVLNKAVADGGGMFNRNSNAIVENCIFRENSTDKYDGGGLYNYQSDLTIINCQFIGNSSPQNGGGMYDYQSSPTVTNCEFSFNTSSYNGGGIYHNHSNPTLTNCIFYGNWAGFLGGGTYNGYSSPTVTNCILWGNTALVYPQISGGTVTYSDVEGGWPDANNTNINADPCFVDAVGPDPNLWNLRLRPDSPCIDAGSNNTPNLPDIDMAGHSRIIDGDCDDSAVIDMGAYEFNYAYMGDVDYNCRVNFFDFSIFGRAWETKEGDPGWDWACDISGPADDYIDWRDVAVLCDNWLAQIP